jgi:hypothetical protein
VVALHGRGQKGQDCIQEIMQSDPLQNTNDSVSHSKNIYLKYTLKTTDWDDVNTFSNVRLYRNGDKTHFFSDQANMFISETTALVEIPEQKLLVISHVPVIKGAAALNDKYEEMRHVFLDSCDVVVCEQDRRSGHRLLKLKAKPGLAVYGIFITEMVYEYDTLQKKMYSVSVTYTNDYKIKNMTILYHECDQNSRYAFPDPERLFFDRKGQLRPPYSEYELVDNRDSKKTPKSK